MSYQSLDGSGNSPSGAGAAGTPYLRITYADYSDGTSSPAGIKTNRQNPRDISNKVSGNVGTQSSAVSQRDLSAMVTVWGQVRVYVWHSRSRVWWSQRTSG